MSDQLTIGGIPYGSRETIDLAQSYSTVEGGRRYVRTADGKLITQCFWSKLKTIISGGGWIPPGMDSLEEGADYAVKCLVPRTVSSATVAVTIPAGRRSDIDLDYTAMVDDTCTAGTASIATNDVTFTAPVGAQSYRVGYVPELTMRLVKKTMSGQAWSANWAWTLEFEEA
ncbi:MAG: hypothetical protein GY799_25370 [Desulfobulbaceae bacterium]|nr:hypothetical protein [Desulfobulbaceae bacterium]